MKWVPVLMYHRINRRDRDSSLVLSPETFLRQFTWLQKMSFRFLSLDEVCGRKGKAGFWDRSVAVTFDDGFRDNLENGFAPLISAKKTAALFVVVNWVGQEGFMNWGEIRELANFGITIGSHSLSHRWLPNITNEGELKAEVCDSKRIIEDKIGRAVQHFSYPVGGVDQRVANLVGQAGYRAGWVAGARPTVKTNDPCLSLRRVKVTPRDAHPSHFLAKAYGLKSLFW